MMSCHDVAQAARFAATSELTAGHEASKRAGAATSVREDDPRMSEILTVLNDVFDSFCAPSESGILTGIHSA